MSSEKKGVNGYVGMLIFLAVCFAVIIAVLVFPKLKSSNKPKYDLQAAPGGKYYDSENNVSYISCNASVIARKLGSAYALFGDNTLYEIQRMNPKEYISGDENSAAGVLRADTAPDITLNAFEAIGGYIYTIGADKVYTGTLLPERQYIFEGYSDTADYKDDKIYTNAIISALVTGNKISAPVAYDESYTLHIYLCSAKYAGLYYDVLYLRDNNGISYLYNPGTSECAYCPDDVTIRLWGGE